MNPPPAFHPLSDLEVVGYATRLTPLMRPAIVAPIYRFRANQEHFLLPPFTLAAGLVCNGREIVAPELARLNDAGEVTRLPEALPAKENHELWVDAEDLCHYEPIPVASATLRGIALKHIEAAKHALLVGDHEKAQAECRTALCADDRLVDPLAIQAAIARRAGNAQRENLLRKFAEPVGTPEGFQALVEHYSRLEQTPRRPAPLAHARSPISGMAAMRPDDYAKAA